MPAQTYTTTDHDEALLRVYSRDKLFEPCERAAKPFWDEMEEATDERPGGTGRRFRIIGARGWAQGNPAEAGDFSESQRRLETEGTVTGAQFDSVVQLSMKFVEASKQDGSWSGDAEHEAIVEATTGLFSYAQRILACGHGTGRLAIVESNTGASTTFTAKLPESTFQLRRNQPVDFVNLDTGGTVQSSAKITNINPITRTVTLDTALTLTANWGVYQADVYGNPISNGVRNIVDDGDFGAALFGITRSAAPYVNATILDNSGSLQDYSEELLRDLMNQIGQEADQTPTVLRSNSGLIDEHYRATVPDRVFNAPDGKAPSYSGGANHERLMFTYGSQQIPWKQDRDLPARELFALHMPSFRKHTLRKADWVRAGNGKVFNIKPSTTTYSYVLIGSQLMDLNISCRRPNSNGALKTVRDRGSARDT